MTKVRNVTASTLAEAYVELLEWDINNQFPETLIIDEARLKDLQERLNKIIIIGAIMLVTSSTVGSSVQNTTFKDFLKEHLTVLLQSTNTEKLNEILPNIIEQVVQDVNDTVQKTTVNKLNEDAEKLLRNQILDVGKADHRIRQLIRKCCLNFEIKFLI